MRPAAIFPVLLLGTALAGCRSLRPPVVSAPPAPPATEASPAPKVADDDATLVVKKVPDEIIVAAWAEPSKLPLGGGQAQLLVRVQKRGGAAYPDVEVRFRTSTGSLYSGGNIIVTDRQGLTRDRLTTRQTATVTLNAGGTRYRFRVPVGEEAPE